MLQSLAPHESLVIARKRRGLDQATAAAAVGCGLHDYIAIEKGRLRPASTAEGKRIADAIEREFGVAVGALRAAEAPTPEAATA